MTTRTSDTYVDLTDRSRAANASESDIFVSIHINASGSSDVQGIETYYYQPLQNTHHVLMRLPCQSDSFEYERYPGKCYSV